MLTFCKAVGIFDFFQCRLSRFDSEFATAPAQPSKSEIYLKTSPPLIMGKKRTTKSNGKKAAFEKKPFAKNIIGGRVDGISVRAFEIRNADLWNCEIYVSKILNSSLNNCKVFNSEIESSNVFDSKLHEVQLSSCETSRCEISAASLALRRFPSEIRRIILGYCIEPEYGVTPPVVAALRGEPQLYGEVLELYYKRCVVPMSPKTFKEYKKMSKRVFKEVKQVRM